MKQFIKDQLGASSGTSLPQIASLVYRMSADSLALNDGDLVSSWTDSINGAVATASTTARPTYKTNITGGKPCVRFNGSTNVLQVGRPAALATSFDSNVMTTVVVCKVSGGGANATPFSCFTGTGQIYVADGTNVGIYGNLFIPYAASTFSVIGHTKTNTLPYTLAGSGAERSYLNGTCANTQPNLNGNSQGNNFAIGARPDSLNFFNGDIYEILHWNKSLNPAEMLQVQKWVCDKYSQAYPWAGLPYFTVFDGDSITSGIGTTVTTQSYPYQCATAMGRTYGQYTNLGVSGILLRDMINKCPEFSGVSAVIGLPVRVASFEYYNEKATAPATLQGYINSYCAAVRAFLNTKLIFGTSTSSLSDPDANRVSDYTYIVTNSASLCDARADIHLNTNIGISGAAATDGNVTYFFDGIHLKPAGYTVLSGIMQAAITSF